MVGREKKLNLYIVPINQQNLLRRDTCILYNVRLFHGVNHTQTYALRLNLLSEVCTISCRLDHYRLRSPHTTLTYSTFSYFTMLSTAVKEDTLTITPISAFGLIKVILSFSPLLLTSRYCPGLV